MRKSLNPFGYKFIGLKEKNHKFDAGLNEAEQSYYRSEDWNKMIIINEEANKILYELIARKFLYRKQTSAYKNYSTTTNGGLSTPKSNA